MTRLEVWLSMVLGTALSVFIFPRSPSIEDGAERCFFAGIVLVVHWLMNREKRP